MGIGRVKLFIFLPPLFKALIQHFFHSEFFAINYSPFPTVSMTLRLLHTHRGPSGVIFHEISTSHIPILSGGRAGPGVGGIRFNVLSLRYLYSRTTFFA